MTDRREVRGVRVDGRVQGVGFRAWTKAQAEGLGVDGWVRNTPDGAVEAVLAGPPEALDRMMEALKRGPAGASVSGLSPLAADAPELGFLIRR